VSDSQQVGTDKTDAKSHTGKTGPERAAGETILAAEGLRKSFGGITAVDGVEFEVERGTITGLIGPNGAGKSTTFNLLTGVHTPDSGRVLFDGTDITGWQPDRIARQGLVRSFQIARELKEMTVMENVMLAPPDQFGERFWSAVLPGLRGRVARQETQLRERAWETLEFFELDHLADERAGSLSGGQRKLLEMARVLMTDPEMILLDEPMAGVNPTLEEKLLDRLTELQEQGYTFLFVEHDMDVVMNHCDPIVVLHQGQVLAEGGPERVRNDERVLEAYLGGEVES
jgi:ABC-type branched-subunit amino acid transport system ATPase component